MNSEMAARMSIVYIIVTTVYRIGRNFQGMNEIMKLQKRQFSRFYIHESFTHCFAYGILNFMIIDGLTRKCGHNKMCCICELPDIFVGQKKCDIDWKLSIKQ